MKKIFTKKKILLIVLSALMILSLTGCSGDRDWWKSGIFWISGVAPSEKITDADKGNKALAKETFINFIVEDKNSFSSWYVTKDGVEGQETLDESVIHNLAVIMGKSVFGDEFSAPNGKDVNKNAEDVAKYDETHTTAISSDPVTLIKSVNTATIKALNEGNDVAKVVVNAVKGLAIVLLIIMWGMEFVSSVVQERFTPETLLKTLSFLLIGVLITLNASNIINVFCSAGNAVTNAIFNGINDDSAAKASSVFNTMSGFRTELQGYVYQSHKVVAFSIYFLGADYATVGYYDIDVLWAILLLAAPFVGQLFCAYQIVSKLIMRMFELLLRILFAPIPLSIGITKGFDHDTKMFFRQTLACAIQPAFMLVGALFFTAIVSAVGNIFGIATGDTVGLSNLTGISASLCLFIAYYILSVFFGKSERLTEQIIAR